MVDQQRRILVTGAGGFIGRALTRRLEAAGHEVRALDLPHVIARAGAGTPVAHDLTRALPAQVVGDVDIVIHAAALAGVQPSWQRPEAYWQVNAAATELLRAACERAGEPRVVHLSSISIYGEGLNLSERSSPHPLSPYGRSKLAGELVWAGYSRATIVRLSNVYGPGQRSDMAYATFIRAAREGRAVTLRDAGRQLRTPTYIDDCVAGIIAAIDRGAGGAAYNIAGPEDIRLSDVPRVLAALLKRPISSRNVPPAPGDPRVATVSCDFARRALGYTPQTSVSAGLAAQVDTWRRAAAPVVSADAGAVVSADAGAVGAATS